MRIDMLPAAHGDCLWVEWFDANAAKNRRLLIDGGPASTYHHLYERIRALPKDDRHFELFIITHIDADHIEGALRLLIEPDLGVTFGDVWFNGWDQIKDLDTAAGGMLNIAHGQMLTDLLNGLVDSGKVIWNGHYNGMAIMTEADVEPMGLRGGATVHVVGPPRRRLIELRDEWEEDVEMRVDGTPADYLPTLLETAKFRPLSGDFPTIDEIVPPPFRADTDDFVVELDDEVATAGHLSFGATPEAEVETFSGQGKAPGSDDSEANGASIAIVLTHGEHAVLLAADAFADDLHAGITDLSASLPCTSGRLMLDAFKLPHHGSIGNLTQELIEAIDCRDYLISTNGATFHHPHRDALELIKASQRRAGRPRFHFNYRTDDAETAVATIQGDVECHWPLGSQLGV